MASWPSDLPQEFLQEGFELTFADNVIRSTVDAGPAQSRRRFTAAPQVARGAMSMSLTQLESFEDFLKNEIADGAISFTFPSIRGRPRPFTARLTAPPRAAPDGGINWLVQIEMLVLP